MDFDGLADTDGLTLTETFDPFTFLVSSASIGEASALSFLFWPEFTEYRDCVFLSFAFEQSNADLWFESVEGREAAVEIVLNHVHLWDYFDPESDADYLALSQLAPRIAEMWRAALRTAFPDRQFDVSFVDDPEDYGPTIYLTSIRSDRGLISMPPHAHNFPGWQRRAATVVDPRDAPRG